MIQPLQVIQSIQVIQIIQVIQKVQVRLTYLGFNVLCFFFFWDELMNCLKRFEAKLISVWEGNASHSSFGLLMSNFAKEEEDLEFVKSLISKQMSLLLILTMEREKLSEKFRPTFITSWVKNIARIVNAVQVTLWLSVTNPLFHD